MNEKIYLQDLAKETMEYATSEIMNKRRDAWSEHNDLNFTKPLIYIRSIPFTQILPENKLLCQSKENRALERTFLLNRYRMTLKDDYIIEPYISVGADRKTSPESVWGVPCTMTKRTNGSASKFVPSLINEEDIENFCVADYEIDEEKTAENYEKMFDILGDSIPIDINYQAILSGMWKLDMVTDLAKMRGLEQLMWDIYDHPEWLHKVLGLMQSKILEQIDATEKAGNFKASNNQNQAMPYSNSLIKPSFNQRVSSAKDIWCFCAAQEYACVGPDNFKEFLFDYQKPIIERFGLCSYGCCEDLTQKIDIIKELSNLRRIAVSPFANVKKCAEQIGRDYVISWRPNPATAVSRGVDEDFVRKEMQENFKIFKEHNSIFDVTLKDVETIEMDLKALNKWTDIIREEIEKTF